MNYAFIIFKKKISVFIKISVLLVKNCHLTILSPTIKFSLGRYLHHLNILATVKEHLSVEKGLKR